MAMMSGSALPDDWMAWLRENLARGCSAADMKLRMIADGGFPDHLCDLALAQANADAGAAVALPSPDVVDNKVMLAGRICPVVIDVSSPRVVLVDNFLSEEECDTFVTDATSRLKRSTVVSDDGPEIEVDKRTSSGTFYHRGSTPLVEIMEKRLADFANWPVDRGEGLQILYYGIGGEYRPHYDWFDSKTKGGQLHLQRGGQRVATQIMYLSDVDAGGSTTFPKLGLTIRPRKGSMLFFTNILTDGSTDQMALHGGAPVLRGTKMIATKWLRMGTY
jgi:prolyl 4-hydroxylase